MIDLEKMHDWPRNIMIDLEKIMIDLEKMHDWPRNIMIDLEISWLT